MPVSIPVMWVLNSARTKCTSLQHAQRLSTIWWGRLGGYAVFGLGMCASHMPRTYEVSPWHLEDDMMYNDI